MSTLACAALTGSCAEDSSPDEPSVASPADTAGAAPQAACSEPSATCEPTASASDAGATSPAEPSRDASDGAAPVTIEEASTPATDAQPAPPTPTNDCRACASYGAPTLRARIAPAELAEVSGTALSVRNPGVLFVHNDRARPDVYALGEDGSLLARFTLPGASAVDVEDMAVGPCPQGTCVYLADIGGNLAPRTEFAILRFVEPEVPGAAGGASTEVTFERFRFEYEDGSHNAEGMLVDPSSGAVYVVTKVAVGQPSVVYALPHPLALGSVLRALVVAELPVPAAGDREASAAAAHPCGLGFALRTYDAVYEFRIEPGAAFESAFTVTPVAVPAADEPQSEAIAYFPDGHGFVTTGEGAQAPIYQTLCP